MVSSIMPEPEQPNADERPPNEGQCAGGPFDGQKLSCRARYVEIPFAGKYEFRREMRMWVWLG